MGAEELITACPLCRYNLMHQGGGRSCGLPDGKAEKPKLPVRYFTEVLAEALDVKEQAEAWLEEGGGNIG